MAHPYKSAAHKSDPKWMGGVRKYADGGPVSATMRGPQDDRMFDRLGPDSTKGRISPLAQQVFADESKGPLNITPNSIPADRRRR